MSFINYYAGPWYDIDDDTFTCFTCEKEKPWEEGNDNDQCGHHTCLICDDCFKAQAEAEAEWAMENAQ